MAYNFNYYDMHIVLLVTSTDFVLISIMFTIGNVSIQIYFDKKRKINKFIILSLTCLIDGICVILLYPFIESPFYIFWFYGYNINDNRKYILILEIQPTIIYQVKLLV